MIFYRNKLLLGAIYCNEPACGAASWAMRLRRSPGVAEIKGYPRSVRALLQAPPA